MAWVFSRFLRGHRQDAPPPDSAEYLDGATTHHAMVVTTVGEANGTGTSAGENHIGQVGGHTAVPASATMTRPSNTDIYASGDLVANSVTAGSVTPLQFTVARVAAGSGAIRRARLRKSGTGITSAQFRLHLYRVSPTVTNGDNGAWLSNQAANYLGSFDISVDKVFSDGAAGNGVPTVGSEINFKLPSGQVVFGLLEVRGAYTPASAETFTLELEVYQD